MVRADNDRRDGAVEMSRVALGMTDGRTVGTMDVFGLGGKIPCGIQRDQARLAHRAHGPEQTAFIKSLMQIVKKAEQMTRFDWVECLADVIIAGDLFHQEERTGIVATAGLFHVLLETEEGGALGEENRESGESWRVRVVACGG